jgi:predicted RNA-binding Zn-ribbon protein involved in translation (DUF1610 family)
MKNTEKTIPCPNCGEMGGDYQYSDKEKIHYKCLICGYKFVEKNKICQKIKS